jgi:DUF4097 and DUF4098 domain-containing protein YvlB
MLQQRRHERYLSMALMIVGAILLLAQFSHASDEGLLTEEFHQTYPLAANGRVELHNVNGAVHITAWDRNEVKVDAVKRARSKERLDEAKIKIEAGNSSISIRTEYPDHNNSFWNDGSHNNPASVEYTLTVPRNASLDEVDLVNGSLDIQGVAGEVIASSVNGHVSAQGLMGRAKLSSVNSRLEAQFERLNGSNIDLDSVNGPVELRLPSDASAELEASTVNGGISNDFGIAVRDHKYVGHDLRAQLGAGATRIRLENVNGRIEILRANDGRPLGQVKDMNRADRDRDSDDDDNDMQ